MFARAPLANTLSSNLGSAGTRFDPDGILAGHDASTAEKVVDLLADRLNVDDAPADIAPKATPHPVVCLLDEQRKVTQLGGTMRLGASDCVLAEGTRTRDAYGQPRVSERHRHRYEFNNTYRERFQNADFAFSGLTPDSKLVEIIELTNHPFFIASQFHPEFHSKPHQPHPLFKGFIAAAHARIHNRPL